MTSKTRLLLQKQNGRKVTFQFLSVSTLGKTSFFGLFKIFLLLLMWFQRIVMSCPCSLSIRCLARYIYGHSYREGSTHYWAWAWKKNLFLSYEGTSCHSTSKYLYQSVSMQWIKYTDVHKTQRKSHMYLIEVFWMIWWLSNLFLILKTNFCSR